ncbi:hypothetical protein WG68_04255 [Arsukibacterium ikkense]|uniref:Uncharacterized protein n=1 Tax=Arsukibacterium ikkense TaxID=336831 RepID=A0A0M2VA70_9GAMM|nr:hypothetical protein [Arsukibacterium ikkense]KKO46530.1 hypothetical protein WG68_04255 [Arsukibacterium ikkense]
MQASSAFVIARGMNALISFLQSVTFEFSFGIGGSVGAGQVLDPLNDLVEQYSSAMKLAIGSLVIQKVLLEIVSDNFFKVLLSLSALSVLVSSAMAGFIRSAQLKYLLLKIFFILLFLRFSLVLVVAANGIVDNAFLHERTENQMQILENIEGVAEHSNPQLDPALNQALISNITELQQQAELLRQNLSQLSQRQQQGQQELRQREQQLQNLVRELGALQRLNYLNPDPRVQTMNEQIKQRRTMLQSWQAEQKVLQRQLTETVNQIQLAELALEGKTPGFMAAIANSFSSLGDGIAAVKDAVNPRQVYQLKQRLDNAVNNILNLMALFLLKTLILPLLFLFILNKGFKLIWNSGPQIVFRPIAS